MINRVVDLIVKDIRYQCSIHRVCSNKCPYTDFCDEYYCDEYIDSFDDDDVATTVKECIKAEIKRILKDILKEV